MATPAFQGPPWRCNNVAQMRFSHKQDIPAAWGVFCFTCVMITACDPTSPGGSPPQEDSWRLVSAGGLHTCAIAQEGSVWCWGDNASGQLGDGSGSGGSDPRWAQLAAAAVAVSAGGTHSCAVTVDGGLYCWGGNSFGQLGDSTETDSPLPGRVSLPDQVVGVSAGHLHTCAVLANGRAYCWGKNDTGQLGVGNVIPESCSLPGVSCAKTPQLVQGLEGVVEISAGGGSEGSHSCATLDDRSVWCWGENGDGQVGDGTLVSRNSPVRASDYYNVVAVTAGERHTCATLLGGEVHCWGAGFGEPMRIQSIEHVSSASAGDGFTCAILDDTTSWCWGGNDLGQLGDGTNQDRVYPSQVSGVLGIARIAAGGAHACAITDKGQLWCWGSNSHGQVGGTNQLTTNLPARVLSR